MSRRMELETQYWLQFPIPDLVSVADLYDRTFAIFVSLCMVEEAADKYAT